MVYQLIPHISCTKRCCWQDLLVILYSVILLFPFKLYVVRCALHVLVVLFALDGLLWRS
jgi:hypothetical protein